MTNDSIGRIANAHLAHTDLYGFKTEVCSSILLTTILYSDGRLLIQFYGIFSVNSLYFYLS